MGIFQQFPYSNFHEMNLDWLLSKMKELGEDFIKLADDFKNFVAETEPAIRDEVDAWLDEHPEATTTVQDGSLTEAKFTDALKLKTIKDYITPQMFGAEGDGTTDDTVALREAVYYSHTNGNVLFFPAGKKYYVTGSLNYYNNAYYECVLNMLGCNPTKHPGYSLSKYGGIILDDGVALFQQANIHGSIRNLSIVGKTRDTGTSIFKNGVTKGLTLYGCNISQIGALFYNYGCSQTTLIDSNIFLTLYYFAKVDSLTNFYGCDDTLIVNNYINGGVELFDNYCFGWIGFNGSTITNNFIDYYRVIFEPHAYQNTSFAGGIVSNNQFQVFRHLTWFSVANHVISGAFTSINDCFNWTDVTKNTHCAVYTPFTYIDKDGNTQNYPPSIFFYNGIGILIIKNAIIQRNIAVGDIISLLGGTTDYSASYGEFTCDKSEFDINVINTFVGTGRQKAFYNNGQYKYNQNLILKAVIPVGSLPNFSTVWSDSFPGQKILYNNVVYTATLVYSGGSWSAKWLDKFGNEAA